MPKGVEEFVDWLENPLDKNGQPIEMGSPTTVLRT